MESIDCAVTLPFLLAVERSGRSEIMRERRTHRKSVEHARTVRQALAISGELWGDGLPPETSVLGKDPIPGGPTGNGNIDDAVLLSKEVRLLDLVGVALKIFGPFAQGGCLKLRGLSVEEAEVARDDEFVDEIDPDPGLGGEVGVGRYYAGCVLWVSVFKELEDDMRVVKGFPLIGDCGDQSSGVEGCMSVRRSARGGRDVGLGGKRTSIETRDGENGLSDQA